MNRVLYIHEPILHAGINNQNASVPYFLSTNTRGPVPLPTQPLCESDAIDSSSTLPSRAVFDAESAVYIPSLVPTCQHAIDSLNKTLPLYSWEIYFLYITLSQCCSCHTYLTYVNIVNVRHELNQGTTQIPVDCWNSSDFVRWRKVVARRLVYCWNNPMYKRLWEVGARR